MATKSVERTKLQKPDETPALRTYFADLDRAAVSAIGERFGAFIPAEHLKRLPDLPSQFESAHDLHKAYRAETGHKAPAGLAGFTSLDSPAHIAVSDSLSVPETVFHERLHQLSSPDAKRILGKHYEGVTQDLAIEALGQEPQEGDLTGYPVERERAHSLRKLVGTDAVCKAYFQGDEKPLMAAMDRIVGDRPLAGLQDKIMELPPLKELTK